MTDFTRRWEDELNKPMPFKALYVSDEAIRHLRYTLGHLTDENPAMTLSEAMMQLCNDYIVLGNKVLYCEGGHKSWFQPEDDDEDSEDSPGGDADDLSSGSGGTDS